MSDQITPYGFDWGPMTVTRLCHIPGRGYELSVDSGGRELTIWVSEKGKSVRVWRAGRELS